MDLTPRQVAIIKAVIEEYTSTAEPVGSVTLEQKYRFGVSAATLRNEMAVLVEKGYLAQPHFSAGRIPSPKAIKFYVSELLEEQRLSVAEEVAVKEKVWERRENLNSLLKEAAKVLSERTKSLSVIALDESNVYRHGYSYLFESQGLRDLEVAHQILLMLDSTSRLLEVFSHATSASSIHLLVGAELGNENLLPVSCLYADIHIGDKRGSLGIVTSSCQTYEHNIPLVRYVANLVNQVAQEW